MTKKLQYPTFEVTLWDENGEATEVLTVRPAHFAKINDIKELQTKLIEAFEAKKGSLGELLADKTVYASMKKLAAMLRIVGSNKPGLDIDNLYEAGDIVQLGQIFFSESVSADMKCGGYSDTEIGGQKMKLFNKPAHRQNPTPSAIARIHDLAFFDLLMEIRTREEMAQIETETETEKSEPLKVAVTAA